VLYAGGAFTDAGGDTDADRIAKFSGGAWSSLGGAGTGLNSNAYAIAFNGGVLYAGGDFTDAGGDPNADRIAKFSGGVWSSLGGAGTDLNNSVYAIAFNGGVLYAGGFFTDAGGDADADRIAQFGLPPEASGSSGGGQQGSKEIAASGTTTFYFQRAYVSVPASAIPPGETGCKIVVANKGDSGQYGFALDDVVYDVKIVCDSGPITILFDHITVCIRPKDGVTTNKQLFHKHSGASSFAPLAGGTGPSGYVCGSTQVLSLFTLGQFGLPATGFAPGVVTQLSEQPAASTYLEFDALMLEIPQLDVLAPIWGVPQTQNGWDVSWLGPNAGYLYGTAFPTWVGNSVLTAHVWNADNAAGPFYHLKDLQYGDQFFVHANGQTYVYEVRTNQLVSESNLSVMKDSDYSLVTLITCESFSEASGEYLYRRAVQAVLVDVY
jgi:LPXTG-site transpeptidase (sortase) family protein